LRRVITTLALALVIGFVSYRAAIAVVASDLGAGTSVSSICAEGKVSRPLFDALTGVPAGDVVCHDGGAEVIWGPIQVDLMFGPWACAVLLGLGTAVLALIVLWWFGRRRTGASPMPLRRQSTT
jgi:hypothetical protein